MVRTEMPPVAHHRLTRSEIAAPPVDTIGAFARHLSTGTGAAENVLLFLAVGVFWGFVLYLALLALT
jgi:hypothetical protein